MANDIYNAMETLNIEISYVFGVSQDGMIAMALSFEYLEKVGNLVLGVTSSRTNENIKKVVNNWAECAYNRDYSRANRSCEKIVNEVKSI